MRIVLELPVATPLGKQPTLAFIMGRKTGNTYHQPMNYVRDGDTFLTPGGSKWKLDLQVRVPVRLRIRGKDVTARTELVAYLDEVDHQLSVILESNPCAGTFVRLQRQADGSLD